MRQRAAACFPGATASWLLPVALLATPAMAQQAPSTASFGPAAALAPAASLMGTGLRVSDLDRSIRFYTGIFGMTEAMRLPHGSLTEVMLTFGGKAGPAIILLKDSAPGKSPPIALGDGFAKIVVDVRDLDALVARMKQAGLTSGTPHESMGVKVLFVTDPDGYRYELIQRGTRP
ncbi:MAG TPA: VOC family protein [Sphingobium sp.]|uniref:VOC family protein n=1 Tax=Sphingobium sp. TaxID=1912891 RepID=UPI002ED557E2